MFSGNRGHIPKSNEPLGKEYMYNICKKNSQTQKLYNIFPGEMWVR